MSDTTLYLGDSHNSVTLKSERENVVGRNGVDILLRLLEGPNVFIIIITSIMVHVSQKQS